MVVLQCKKSPPKKRGESLKKEISSFLGNVGLIKVVLEFLFGHSKCHFFVPENDHFWQKCQKMQTEIRRPLL